MKKKGLQVQGNRSQAEEIVISLLRFHFKRLTVLRNDRTILGRQEIDIYLPEFKFAIEIDGIVHRKPIHGKDTLNRIQTNDRKKTEKLHELGIKLYRIPLPDKSSECFTFLKEEVNTHLVSSIKDWLTKGI